FSCPRGFGLQGAHHELFCQESGQWSNPLPVCIEVRCAAPEAPEHGFTESFQNLLNEDGSTGSGPYLASDIVQHACDPGFMLEGNPISICQESGRWSGPRPRCVPACSYPGLMHGARLLSDVRFFYPLNQ